MKHSPLRRLRLRTLRVLRSVAGAFDLPSILVGVVVVAILAAGILAAVFGVIPFSQDNSATQDLDTVRTAEGVAMAHDSGYLDKQGLIDAPYMAASPHLAVGTDAQRTCYLGLSKSGTGNIFYSDNKANEAKELVAGATVNCLTTDQVNTMVTDVGGFSSSPTAAPSPTDGSSTSPTAGGGSTVLAADTWSAQRAITNIYPDPGFKIGISGWTGNKMVNDYTDNAATTVSYAGTGYNGDAGALRITATGSTNNDRTTAYFPVAAPNSKDFSFQITTPDGTWDPNASWYGGVIYTDLSGNYLDSGSSATPTRAGGLGANVWERFDVPNYVSAPAVPHNTYLVIQADNIPAGKTISMLVDRVFAAGDACGSDCAPPPSPSVANYAPNFDGSYPSSADWTYSWTGAVNASPSKAVSPRRIAAPATAVVGNTIAVKGTGFTPNSAVTPAIFFGGAIGWDTRDFFGAPVQTDGSGAFDTTVLIPANTQPWNWGVGVVEDTAPVTTIRMNINSAPGTGPSTATPPGPWSVPEAGTTEQISAPSTVTLGPAFSVPEALRKPPFQPP